MTGSAFRASKSHRYRAMPPLFFSCTPHQHSQTPCTTLPLQSQEGARSKPQAAGAPGICCDERRKKHGFGAESGPAPVNRSSAVPFSRAGVTACKFAQAADSLVIRTSTYHSEVCKIGQEMPAFFLLLFSSPNYSSINFFHCKFLVFSNLNDSVTLAFTAPFSFPCLICSTNSWSPWLLAKLGHPHPVLSTWLGSQNAALCSLSRSLTHPSLPQDAPLQSVR